MGCAFLIVLASIGFGIQDSIRKEILQDQAITQVEVFPSENEELNLKEIKRPFIGAIVQRTSMDTMTSFHFEDRMMSGDLRLTDMKEEEQSNLKLSEGRLPKNESEIIVGYHFAQNLWTDAERIKVEEGVEEADLPKGYEKSIIGKEVSLSLQPYELEKPAFPEQWDFTVVGVMENPAKDWIVDSSVLMDESWLPKLTAAYEANGEQVPEIYTNTKIYTSSLEHVKSVTKDLKDMGYNVFSVSEQLEQIDVFFMAFKIGLIFVGDYCNSYIIYRYFQHNDNGRN